MNIDAKVTATGPLFAPGVRQKTEGALKKQVLEKVSERWQRKGRRLGRKNNTLTVAVNQDTAIEIASTLNWPRTRGTSWQRKQVAIARAMTPRVLRAAARKLAQELGG